MLRRNIQGAVYSHAPVSANLVSAVYRGLKKIGKLKK
jgi:hypothetical protein